MSLGVSGAGLGAGDMMEEDQRVPMHPQLRVGKRDMERKIERARQLGANKN